MANITAAMVKELRGVTGAGPLDCKKALEQTDGDIEKAIDFLREKGLARAAKKLDAGRTMQEGLIEMYLHFSNRLGVMVEVNCETDFVAATDAFKGFCKDVAMHIASMNPEYVRREDVPQNVVDYEREIQKRRAMDEGKPEHIAEKMVEGRMNKFFEDIVLMEQALFKDDEKTIADLLQETVAEVGESIQIARFARYELGQHDEENGKDEG